MGYQGWAIFMDCDMLCRGDISELWALREDRYAVLCVQHDHRPNESAKFLGEVQSAYPKKNWSSLMLLNCARCTALTPDYVNTASGLQLHRFDWLDGDHQIGALPDRWNHLVDVQPAPRQPAAEGGPTLLHWTLGGPWFREQRTMGGPLAAEWFSARDDALRLWD
jgi:lipopolysaccharide biosynthesis glycosyltransferase